jgi:hypothetical protein
LLWGEIKYIHDHHYYIRRRVKQVATLA